MANLSANRRTGTGWRMSSQRSLKWTNSWQEQERHSSGVIKWVMGHPHGPFLLLYLVQNQGPLLQGEDKGPTKQRQAPSRLEGKGILEATMSTGCRWMFGYRICVGYLTSLSSTLPVCKTVLLPPTHRGLSNHALGFQLQEAQHRAHKQQSLMISPLSSKASRISQSYDSVALIYVDYNWVS